MQTKSSSKPNDPKSSLKTPAKEIFTPSFAKLVKEDSPKNFSNFKEIKRLKAENIKLLKELERTQEELSRKDEFALVLSSVAEEKYDLRRMYMYKAKAAKQERLVRVN
jgi:hypothetical protein